MLASAAETQVPEHQRNDRWTKADCMSTTETAYMLM
jgi:hypothetical protein